MKFRKAISIFSISALMLGVVPGIAYADSENTTSQSEEIKDEEEIVTPGDDTQEPAPVDPTPTDNVREEEEVYNPSPSTNRQTNEEVEIFSGGRTATGTQRGEVEKTVQTNVNQAMSASSKQTKPKKTETTSRSSVSEESSTPTTVQTVQETRVSSLDSIRTAQTDIGETSEAPKTADRNTTLPIATTFLILAVFEVAMLRVRMIRSRK